MNYLKNENKLIFYFKNDFDYQKIKNIKSEVINIINNEQYELVIFDFYNTSFIDSTGIGFILARYKQLKERGIKLYIANISDENKIILEMSGIFQIINIIKNEVKVNE